MVNVIATALMPLSENVNADKPHGRVSAGISRYRFIPRGKSCKVIIPEAAGLMPRDTRPYPPGCFAAGSAV